MINWQIHPDYISATCYNITCLPSKLAITHPYACPPSNRAFVHPSTCPPSNRAIISPKLRHQRVFLQLTKTCLLHCAHPPPPPPSPVKCEYYALRPFEISNHARFRYLQTVKFSTRCGCTPFPTSPLIIVLFLHGLVMSLPVPLPHSTNHTILPFPLIKVSRATY